MENSNNKQLEEANIKPAIIYLSAPVTRKIQNV